MRVALLKGSLEHLPAPMRIARQKYYQRRAITADDELVPSHKISVHRYHLLKALCTSTDPWQCIDPSVVVVYCTKH